MLKKFALFLCLGLLSATAVAKDLSSLVSKTKNCKTDYCVYSHDFIENSQVKKAVVSAFTIQGFITPQWLTSDNVVSSPAVYGKIEGVPAIKLSLCKPHNCGTDNVEGYFLIKEKVFVGDYTRDGKEPVYVGPDN